MADIHKVLGYFKGVKSVGENQWKAFSPLRRERNRSLSIKHIPSEDRILLHDFGDHEMKGPEIISAAGGSIEDIQPRKENRPLQWWEKDLQAEYRYIDENNHYLYSKLRYPTEDGGKDILYARIIDGNYDKGKGNAEHTLYNLLALLGAINKGFTVYFTEGEKDVDTLKRNGLTATTAGGVDDWKKDFARFFIGASVVVLADNDDPGKKFADKVMKALAPVAYRRKIVFTSLQPGGDVTDYLEEGHTKEEFLQLVEEEPWHYASWIDVTGKDKRKVNVGILAEEVLNRNSIILARNPGTNADLLYWYLNGRYTLMSDAQVIGKVKRYIPTAMTSPNTLKNVSALIKYGADAREYDDLNANETFINLRNGLFDFREKKLEQHSPNVFSSIQLNCNYDPKAVPVRWLNFIDDLCRDEDGEVDNHMVAVIGEWVGLILSPIYGFRIKKSLVLFAPEGNTGRSVFLSVISKLIGTENVANVSFQDMGSSRWATGRAFGKRLLNVGDQGSESIDDSSVFKQLTGGDMVSAEFKGLQGFDYTFRGMVVAACNSLPTFKDDKGNHMADRLMFLHCRNVIPSEKRDPQLIDKLEAELDGIFLWAMEGLSRFIANGWRFTPCDSAESLMTDYRKRYDTLYSFLDERCEVTGNKSDYIRKTDFETMYKVYCATIDFKPIAKVNIPQRAAALGIILATLDGNKVYRGVKLKAFYHVEDAEPYEK